MAWWVRLYFDHTTFVMGSPVRWSWPGGERIDRQPSFLVEMFYEIERGILKELELAADGARQRN